MKYEVFGKKIDGSVHKMSVDPVDLDSALYKVKVLTWMENRKSNKFPHYLYFYCLPVKKEEL